MNAVEWLRDVAERNAEREFLVDVRDGRTLTFGGLRDSAARVAEDLRVRGLERGDRVAVLAHNSSALAELYFGCLYAGVVVVPVNPVLARPEIDWIVEHSEARLVFVTEQTRALAADAVVLGEDAWWPAALPAAADVTRIDAEPDDLLVVIYTSGTTGRPNGVVHTVSDLVDNGRLFSKTVGVKPEHRFYGILAMTYLGGYYNLLLLPYVAEASVALSDVFGPRAAIDFWGPAEANGVTALWLVPTLISILMEMDRGTDGERFCREQVDLALVGTAPLPLSMRRSFEERYGIGLLEDYGLSETLFMCTNSKGRPVPDGSAGRLLDGVKVQISDEDEILVKTPYLMQGYWGGEPVGDGWFPTGDLGRLEDGELYITGRKKDLIIRGGVNVSPAAAEDVLLSHAAVAECAVVGVPHRHYGEDALAAVRLVDGADSEAVIPELEQLCRERLGSTNRPGRIVELDAFPHSSSGKIQKNKLREQLAPQEAAR